MSSTSQPTHTTIVSDTKPLASDSNRSVSNANLQWNEAGTPVSGQFDDVYFSNVNGLEESRYVFLQQNHLPHRWQNYDRRRFVIAETGFGTGLNFLAAWQWFEQFRAQCPEAKLQELHFISFEKFPLSIEDLKKSHQAWPELAEYAAKLQKQYPVATPECHRIVLAEGAVTLDLWLGDIKTCLPLVPTHEQGIVDAWFLDGFAPGKNPEMWNQALFNGMAQLAKHHCSCATFTAAGFVRRGLIEAGFEMKKVKGFGTKREMLTGQLANKKPYSNIKPWFAVPAASQITEAAIIGGGVATAALAASLINRGLNVTIYCKDSQAAQNASGNRQGALYPLLNKEHSGVSRVFAPAFLFARQFFDSAAQQFHFDHDWCGVTHIGWNDNAAQKLNNILQGPFDADMVQHLTQQQMNEQVGLPVDLEGLTYPMGGWLSPQQFTQNLIQHLIEQGKLTFVNQCEITQIERNRNHSWTLKTADSVFQHQCVVIANGHNADQFIQTKPVPQAAVKGQVSHIPTNNTLNRLSTVLCYNGYLTPHNPVNDHHCIGASHDRVNINQDYDAEAQQENAYKLRRSLPDQEWVNSVDVSGQLSKQGIRSSSRDHLPFVGTVCDFEQLKSDYADLSHSQDNARPVAHYDNLFCFLALGGRGLCSAPLMAELLASQICGDPLPLPVDVLETLHPGRMWVRKLLKGKKINTFYPHVDTTLRTPLRSGSMRNPLSYR